jgi:hypothetical protein
MSDITLRRHRLPHIAGLKVDPHLVTARFDRQCATTRCAGRCCATGVWADAAERDAILRHADAIQRHMDETQEREPSRWFEAEPWDHADFPSGRAFGTEASSSGCVFLRRDRRCALQAASDMVTGRLKPVFCYAFPVTIVDGVLCLDEPRDPACCTPSAGGTIAAPDLCAEELQMLLGEDGVNELRSHAKGEAT